MATRATLHRHEGSHSAQEWIEAPPAPQLGTWVTGYTGYREEADAPVHRLETPSGGAVLVISFGDPLTVSEQPARTTSSTRPAGACVVTSFAGGISDRPALTTHAGRQHGAQVRLGPLSLYALFGTPLDELGQNAGGVVGLDDLGAGDWGARLGAARTWELRFALLDELLTARLARRGVDPTPEVAHAWRRLRASHGSARISELVDESGLSHRGFVSRFRRQVGVAPKTAARILRYERATALLATGARSVAEVAAVSGYADQAHLDRDFAALAGRSPTRLVQERAGSGYQSVRSILFKTGEG
ncbi:MAG TPA: AraC family transcriptional regulator [Acidimicrobiales bacterium]|nr:AraC family transcriptional regulator [Acidimicrobiales bacterium]